MPFLPRPCAEFPNDNPDLHDGASWVCGWTRAQPRAVLSARGTVRMSAAPPANAPFETRTESSAEPTQVDAVEALPALLEGVEAGEPPLESDVRLIVPETEAAEPVEDAAEPVKDAAEPAHLVEANVNDVVETVVVAALDVEDAAEPAHLVEASVNDVVETVVSAAPAVEDDAPAVASVNAAVETADVVSDVESYFDELDRKQTSATEEDAPATFALVSEPFAPLPDVVERSAPLATTGTDGQTAPVARDAFTPKDRQDLETAFGRFLGIDADDPSEDLSALISATREPVQTGFRPMTSDGAAGEVGAYQLELDLTTGPKQLTLTLDTPNSNAPPGALTQALHSLDDAFDDAIEFTPSAPAAEVVTSELADDAKVIVDDAKAPQAVAPPNLGAADIQMMHAALAAFDEPFEFTPSPPVAESAELVEFTPSAAIAETPAPPADGRIDTETELHAEPAGDEDVPEQDEAIAGAVAALDELFDTDGSDWHTPTSQLAVYPVAESPAATHPVAASPIATQQTAAHQEDEASLERVDREGMYLELVDQAELLDDPEADIATRRLVLAEDDGDDEETVSLSATRAEQRAVDETSPSVKDAEAISGSFRVPRPEAFEDETDETDEDQDHASLEPLSLELTPPPPGVGGWDRLADFVAGFLLVRSATRAAALLPELLEGKRVNMSRLPEDTIAALCAEGIAERRSDGTFPTAAFRQQANALHLDFMSGRAPTRDLIQWLSVAVRALLGNTVSAAAAYAHLEQAGIAKLLQRAA